MTRESQTTINKQAYALISLYVSEYEKRYNMKPGMNSFQAKWGFQDMIRDLGYEEAQDVIRWYFTTSVAGHPVLKLHQNYYDYSRTRLEMEQDRELRLRLRKETEARVAEYERRQRGDN